MKKNGPSIGVLQGRLTSANGRGLQFFPTLEWRQEFETAQQIGFDCIELLVKKDDYKINPLFSDKGVHEINLLKKKCHLETPSIHGFYSKEAWYPQALDALLQRASLVNAHTVLVSFFNHNSVTSEIDESLARKQLQKPLKTARRLGISIAIEIEMVATKLKSFVESFESSALNVYYDLGNMASMGVNIENDITLLGSLIKGVHIKDREHNGGESVPLGKGITDFKSAFDALKNIGYNGPYIIQGARSKTVDDVTLNKRYFNFVEQKLIENIK